MWQRRYTIWEIETYIWNMMVDASIGWLVDGLIGWCSVWLTGCLIAWLIDWLIGWLVDVQFDWLVAWLIVLPPNMFQTKKPSIETSNPSAYGLSQPFVSPKVGLMKPSFPKGGWIWGFLGCFSQSNQIQKCDSKVQRAIKMLSSTFWFQQWGHESSNANPGSSRSRFFRFFGWWKIWETKISVDEVWEFSFSI